MPPSVTYLGEGLPLNGFELLLVDRPRVEQLLRVGQLGRGASSGLPDVRVEGLLLLERLFLVALGHALAVGDQIDQHAEEREHDDQEGPAGFAPPMDVVPAEYVGEDHDYR